MPNVKQLFTEPDISPKKRDLKSLSRPWFVWFRYFDPSTNSWQLIRKKGGINYFSSLKERLTEGIALRDEIKKLLLEGWNPLTGSIPGHTKEIVNISTTSLTSTNPPLEESENENLSSLINEVYDIKTKGLRENSKKNYRVAKNYFIAWASECNITTIKMFVNNNYGVTVTHPTGTIHKAFIFLDWLYAKPAIGNTTWNNYKQAIKFLFNILLARKIIPSNPFNEIKDKPTNPEANKPFKPEELKRVWDYLKNHDKFLYLFSLLIYYCYLRPIEITRLQIKEFNLADQNIFLPAKKSKNRKKRYPKIPTKLYEELLKLNLPEQNADSYLFGNDIKYGAVKIIAKLPTRRTYVTDRLAAILNKLNIHDRSLYSFKSTGVIAAYKAGIKIKAIQYQCGHSSLEETDIYLRSLGIDTNDDYKNVQY